MICILLRLDRYVWQNISQLFNLLEFCNVACVSKGMHRLLNPTNTHNTTTNLFQPGLYKFVVTSLTYPGHVKRHQSTCYELCFEQPLFGFHSGSSQQQIDNIDWSRTTRMRKLSISNMCSIATSIATRSSSSFSQLQSLTLIWATVHLTQNISFHLMDLFPQLQMLHIEITIKPNNKQLCITQLWNHPNIHQLQLIGNNIVIMDPLTILYKYVPTLAYQLLYLECMYGDHINRVNQGRIQSTTKQIQDNDNEIYNCAQKYKIQRYRKKSYTYRFHPYVETLQPPYKGVILSETFYKYIIYTIPIINTI